MVSENFSGISQLQSNLRVRCSLLVSRFCFVAHLRWCASALLRCPFRPSIFPVVSSFLCAVPRLHTLSVTCDCCTLAQDRFKKDHTLSARDFSPHVSVLRHHFLPNMQFECFLISQGNLGGNFDIFAASGESTAWVLFWKTRSRPIGVRVCPVAQFKFVKTASDPRQWTMVVFWKEIVTSAAADYT